LHSAETWRGGQLLKRSFFSKQFLIFLVTGGTAAVVNFCSRVLYNHWLDFSSAVILAYINGMFTAFVLAKLFVFKHSQQPWQRSLLLFGLVNVFAIGQTWAVSMGLAYYVLPALPSAFIQAFIPEIAHAIGILVPVFSSYLGHKYWSFR
jgi:putative flippase GtrA